MKILKKLTSVFLSLSMIVGTLFSYGVGNNVIYADSTTSTSTATDTITLPLTIRDAHMDGFMFEHKTQMTFDGQKKGLVENQLDKDGKLVYTQASLEIFAAAIQAVIIDQDETLASPYYTDLRDALIAKLGSNANIYANGSSLTSADKPTNFNDIQSYYGAAYWMTYYLFRDGGAFSATSGGKTYSGNYNIPCTLYDQLVLNKQSEGNYMFQSDDTGDPVIYDKTNNLIKNATSGENRIGFFPLDDVGTTENETVTVDVTYPNGTTQTIKDRSHNFAYTLESSGKFVYHKKENLYFDFYGDDDVYLFINNQLVIDLGGTHGKEEGSIYLEETISEDSSTTWAEYLGLKEGEVYDFNFFYMERHTKKANMKINSNIKVYDPSAIPTKKAYAEDGTEIPFGSYVYQGETVTYEFSLTNNGDVNVRNIELVDNQIGVSLKPTGIVLNEETDLSDLTVTVGDKTYPNGTDGNLTEAKLKELLANGLNAGETISIKGFKHTLEETNKFINTLQFKVTAGDKVKEGYTTHEVIPVAHASDKALVIDYGKPVTYNYAYVFAPVTGSTSHNISIQNTTGKYGTMTNDTTGKTITYKLTKFMNGIDTFNFDETITKSEGDVISSQIERITTVKMIPATTIYYEDNFANKNNKDADAGIVYSGNWTEITGGAGTDNIQDGTDSNYGYDSNYGDDSADSNGSVSIVEGNGSTTKATFNFTGTGFDIVGRTSYDSGTIRVDVYPIDSTGEVSTTAVKSRLVATEYEDNGNSSTLYQIPVLKIRDLTHGKYQAVITVYGRTIFSENTKFYLDGIRIYNPMGDDTEANTKYEEDNEANAEYIELRDKLIGEKNCNANGEATDSVLFIDGKGNADLDEYKKTGPNNEVYLAKNQAVGFKINKSSDIASIQIGAKSLNGTASIIVGTDTDSSKNKTIELKTATEMYYDITDYVGADGIIFIQSTGDKPASLTQLKITRKTETTESTVFMVNRAVFAAVRERYSNPIINSATFNAKSVKTNRNIVMTVKTNKNVEELSVLDKSGKKATVKKVTVKEGSDEKVFKLILKSPSKADSEYYYQIIGLDKTGKVESEKFTTDTIKVK